MDDDQELSFGFGISHQKVLPAILTTLEEVGAWMSAPWDGTKHCSGRFLTPPCGSWPAA
jgi:hypothetical protein